MDTVTRITTAADGRELCVEEGGDLSGRVVLVHWGTPNSRHLYGPVVAQAAGQGIHLVSYDRPGYGRSAPQPGRTIMDCVSDVRAVADAVGADRFAVWGISGGGPHALACAALLADRVAAVATPRLARPVRCPRP